MIMILLLTFSYFYCHIDNHALNTYAKVLIFFPLRSILD